MATIIDQAVLSVMPSIRRALDEIASHADSRRLTLIQCPQGGADTVRYWLERALIGLPNARLLVATVGGDHNIARSVANTVQINSLTPDSQAVDRCGGQQVHLLLKAEQAAGVHRVEEYCVAFQKAATERQHDGLRLYLIDDQVHYPVSGNATIGVVRLSELLSPGEMEAYVTLRMADRPGPGNTHLARALVERFAGADPRMAEILIDMPDDQLLMLPASFPMQRLPPPPSDGRRRLMSPDDPQLLFRQTLPGDLALSESAKKKLSQLKSKAFVQALMPWLEEHRAIMCEKMRPVLEDYRARKGALERTTRGRSLQVEMDLVEFNDIVAWEKYHDLGIASGWPQHRSDYTACVAATLLRNAVAHRGQSNLSVQQVLSAIREVEAAF